jgi:hypothetical protein
MTSSVSGIFEAYPKPGGADLMEDPSSKHLWFEAIGGLALIAAIAAFFLVAVVRAEKKVPHRHDQPALTVTGD